MTRFRTILVLSLLTAACGDAADGTLNSGHALPEADAGVGGAELGVGGTDGAVAGAGGAGSDAGPSTAGTGGSDSAQGGSGNGGTSAGGSDAGGSDQGGTGGTDTGTGGSEQGQGGSDVVEQGGTGGSSAGQAGTGGTSAGTGGSDGGTGGTDQGQGGTDGDPTPVCDYQGGTCDGLTYKECDEGEYFESPCRFNCDPGFGGCYGECTNGDVRCADGAAQACVGGLWTVTEQCAFQCVNGACEGACTPGAVVCDGLTTVTCGSDFHYGSPVACPTDPNGTTTCSNGTCDLQPIACSEGTDDCDGDWSCETDLSSVSSCGECGNDCPTRANATRTCDGTCGFTCNAGFEDCDGDPSNGCELDTRANPLNCGACGNSCYGSACTASQCEYEFQVVSDFSGESFTSQIRDVALSATHVYWLTANEVRRAPKSGGEYETLTTTTGIGSWESRGLVVEAGKVCWAGLDGVYVMPEAGGTAIRIYQGRVTGVAAADGKLYWNDAQIIQGGNDCLSQNYSNQSGFLSCSNNKLVTFYNYDLATDTSGATWQRSGEHSAPIAVINGELFVAEYQPVFVNSHAEYRVRIMARNSTTGANGRIVAGTVGMPSDNGLLYAARIQLFGAAFKGDAMVYAAPFTNNAGSSPDALVTGPSTGGGTPQTTNTVLLEQVVASSLDLDGTSAFYADSTGVKSISLEGGTPHPFFDNQTDADLRLAVDDAYIYFSAYATNGEQAILRAPK